MGGRYVVLLGPPGAGKGTHAKILSECYGLPDIAAGDLLRSSIKQGTALGKRAKSFVEKGELVPDGLVIEMIRERLEKSDVTKGFILDGFPRTTEQATALERMLDEKKRAVNLVLEFRTPEAILIERLSGRRICQACGANFHIRNIPSKRAGICDGCGSKLIQRKDDDPKTIRERFRVYENQTQPLIDFYKKRKVLQAVDGGLDVEPLQEVLKEYFISEPAE